MIFESLYESARNNELLLLDCGFCRFHIRRDRQLTIREIISVKSGTGKIMLNILKDMDVDSIYARCPVDLDSNGWYEYNGFLLEEVIESKSGKKINCWRLLL